MSAGFFSSVDHGMAIIAASALAFNFLNFIKIDFTTTDKVDGNADIKKVIMWNIECFRELAVRILHCAIAISFINVFCAVIGLATWNFVFIGAAGSVLISFSMKTFHAITIRNAQMSEILSK